MDGMGKTNLLKNWGRGGGRLLDLIENEILETTHLEANRRIDPHRKSGKSEDNLAHRTL